MFSDDQLKWLKQNIAVTDRERNKAGYFLDMDEWDALLARLEAAEKVVDLARIKRECGDILGETDTIYDAEEAWRKSAGK